MWPYPLVPSSCGVLGTVVPHCGGHGLRRVGKPLRVAPDILQQYCWIGLGEMDVRELAAHGAQQRTLIVPADLAGLAGLVEGVKLLSDTARQSAGVRTGVPPTGR